MIVNQTRLAELANVTPKTLWLWARDEGMPVAARGEHGAENSYDVMAVLAWACQRRAARTDGESQRDRLVRLQADKLEREEAEANGRLVAAELLGPAWEAMIAAAQAALLTLPNRVAGLLVGDDLRDTVYTACEAEVEAILLRLGAGGSIPGVDDSRLAEVLASIRTAAQPTD